MSGKIAEWASRLTGFSTPAGGVSWQPSAADRTVATELLAHLEDRRVLFIPSEAESPRHCAQSVIDIRRLLSTFLAKTGGSGPLADHLRAMGAASRQFMDRLQSDGGPDYEAMQSWGHWRSWVFQDALGQLRGRFGLHIAAIADRFDIEVHGELRSILPPVVEDEDLDPMAQKRIRPGSDFV